MTFLHVLRQHIIVCWSKAFNDNCRESAKRLLPQLVLTRNRESIRELLWNCFVQSTKHIVSPPVSAQFLKTKDCFSQIIVDNKKRVTSCSKFYARTVFQFLTVDICLIR